MEEKIVDKFVSKYFTHTKPIDIWWIDDNVVCINGFYFDKFYIKTALKHNVTEEILFGYYDYVVEKGSNYELVESDKIMSFLDYIKQHLN